MKRILVEVRSALFKVFSLRDGMADEERISESIRRDVNFKGTNLWTLIFAIFIASIGLNVNSTAVVIGAMLISPLMGPIMGVGLGIGTNDFELIKKGLKNLGLAGAISIATSCLYFAVTPLQDASSELLARTNPSLWDVFIAFLGGLAGIVAGTRKEKSNVIPGVAIATALMPPLCTAGFGLATGQWYYFLGAIYLFFINSFFICLATFLIVKKLRFHNKEFSTPAREKRVSRYIIIISVLIILPSIYLAYRIVQRSIFENSAKKFVKDAFHFARTQVVSHDYTFDGKEGKIELLLIGQPLSEHYLDSLRKSMPAYGLINTKLAVLQGLDAKQKIDLAAIKASVLEEISASERYNDTMAENADKEERVYPELGQELQALYPGLKEYSLNAAVVHSFDTIHRDSVILFVGRFKPALDRKEKTKLGLWLKQRLQADSIKLVFE